MPPITLIIEPNPTRDNVRRTGPAAAAGHVGRDPVDASDSRSLACPETRSPSLPYTSTRSRPPLFRGGNNRSAETPRAIQLPPCSPLPKTPAPPAGGFLFHATLTGAYPSATARRAPTVRAAS